MMPRLRRHRDVGVSRVETETWLRLWSDGMGRDRDVQKTPRDRDTRDRDYNHDCHQAAHVSTLKIPMGACYYPSRLLHPLPPFYLSSHATATIQHCSLWLRAPVFSTRHTIRHCRHGPGVTWQAVLIRPLADMSAKDLRQGSGSVSLWIGLLVTGEQLCVISLHHPDTQEGRHGYDWS